MFCMKSLEAIEGCTLQLYKAFVVLILVIFYFLGSSFLKQAEWLSLALHKNCWREKAVFMEWLQMPDLFRNISIKLCIVLSLTL